MKQILILSFFIAVVSYAKPEREIINTSPPSWWYQPREYPLPPELYIMPSARERLSGEIEKPKSVDYLKIYHGNKPYFEWKD